MASRRVAQKVIDWTRLATAVPAEVRGDFNQFRGKYEILTARVNSLPENPQPIEWELYRNGISKPGFVDEFQKQYEALNIPYPKDTTSGKLADFQKDIDIQAEDAIAQSKIKAAELKKELSDIKSQKPFEDMTIDEYLVDKPELREKAQQDAYNHIWYSFKN